MRFMYVVKFFICGTMEICISPKQLLICMLFFYLCYFGGKKLFFLLYIYLLFELFIVTFSLFLLNVSMVCGTMVWSTVHMCASAHGGQSLPGSHPVFLAHSSVYPWGGGLSLNLDTLILALLKSLWVPGMQLCLFLQLWILWPSFYMVSGAELRSAWSALLAGSAFVTYRTNYLLSSHCQVPCSQPQIGPCGACSSLWLLRSYWLWSCVFCGQSVVSHSHSWDKCCVFLFSLPLKRDVVSLSLFPLCKWEWSLTYLLRLFCLCTHLNRILLLLLPFGNSLLI